ncbi:hypothetical protein E2C01_069969 [Portunus trituberculatus]|uniref:Uncharacterized protein n=1 Tax=Portunus trituberculatus TaxID=210409 RepID=A0A5B7I0Z2_PORTR|nr:hypothetical protein [Portunus trituberculatus]
MGLVNSDRRCRRPLTILRNELCLLLAFVATGSDFRLLSGPGYICTGVGVDLCSSSHEVGTAHSLRQETPPDTREKVTADQQYREKCVKIVLDL